MRDDEENFFKNMIGFKILMDSEKEGGGGRPPKSSGGCLSWVMLFLIALVIGVLITQCVAG